MEKIILATTNSEISKREIKHNELARKIANEGIVLLENKGMLPLKDNKIALYGSGARQTVAGGTGSGAMHPRHYVGIEEGFLNAGYEVVSSSWLDKYDKYYDNSYKTWKDGIESKVEGEMDLFKILHVISQDRFTYPTGILVEDEDISKKTNNAVYVIARQAGEGADRKIRKADYLIDDVEYANIKKLCDNYKNVCLVINVGGFIDLSFLDELNINSAIYYAQAGQNGGNALVDIMSGKVSPSAKLTATWPKSIYDIPSTKEFSHLGNPLVQNYEEGIYVGYRYFDTFNIKPRYAFGFGLSYTEFKMDSKVSIKNESIKVKCDVTNIGNISSKEVVQAYVSIPKADAENKRLVSFAKTKDIKAGETQSIELDFSIRDLTWYDEKRAAFILEKGEYVVRVGNSSDATNSIAILEVENEVIVEKCINVCPKQAEFKDLSINEKTQIENISNLPRLLINTDLIETKINTYEKPILEKGKAYDLLNKMSNSELAALVIGGTTGTEGGERLVSVVGASGTSTSNLYGKYQIPNIIFSDGPAGLNVTPRIVHTPDGAIKSLDRYPQYDFGFFGKVIMTRMLGKEDEGVCHYQYATAWPAGVVRAQTWSTELMEEMGDAVGVEMEELGVTVWLAPGMNITRNTLCGRTFEYFSEDPVLSGKLATSTNKGVQNHEGKGVSIKHFACNNSEFERTFSSSNISERALREVYLKGFEIAVKESKPMTVMASYNKINDIYNTNNYDLLTKVLRNEWGFKNAVISDWDAVREDRGDVLKTCYSGCDLVMPGTKKQVELFTEGLDKNLVNREDVIISAKRILEIAELNTVVKFKLEK